MWQDITRLVEMARSDHACVRDFAARIENDSERVLAEVISRIGDHGLDVVKEAVDDALEGRRPRW